MQKGVLNLAQNLENPRCGNAQENKLFAHICFRCGAKDGR